jgi:hypothetical protein
MNKLFNKKAFLGCLVLVFFVGLQSCKKDKNTTPAPVVVPDQSFTQSFDDISAAMTQGWVFHNYSDGPAIVAGMKWKTASATAFGGVAPFDGTKLLYDNYAASNGGVGNLSDWVISPKVTFQNGDVISFYTLSNGTNDGYGDRLQLRLNLINASDSITDHTEDSSSHVGYFTHPMVDVNPLYSIDPAKGFPTAWTKFQAKISGLNGPVTGRFAFRYFVELEGGANGDEIALDKVTYTGVGH